jgi:hypothetical protein
MTLSLLPLRYSDAWDGRAVAAAAASGGGRGLYGFTVVSDDGEDGPLKDLVDAAHLLAAAFHVLGVHLLGHGHALLRRDRSETLCPKHVDACLLVSQVGLESNEYKGGIRAEMEDLRVPLVKC